MTNIGTGIICFSFLFGGFLYSYSEKKRVDIICEVERLIRYMSGCIHHYRKELLEIFISFDSPLLDSCGFSAALSDGWQNAVKTLDCPAEIKNELYALGLNLGMLNAEDQVESCQRCLAVLSQYTESEKHSLPSKMKIYRCLGITAAAAILILNL